MKLSRRSVLRATASTLVAPALGAFGAVLSQPPARAQTQPQTWNHALSLFGDVKYPDGFKNFDYVNPNAPQGGIVRQSAFGTFDNFNTVVAGVKGSIAAGTELFIETLTTPALDEVSTEYGLLAEAVSYPDDHSNVTYRLRANARWHDGKPVTADDVIFSFDVLKKNSPLLRCLLPACREGREDRRARNHIYLRRAGQSRTAADRRPACRCCRSIGGKAPTNRAESATSRRRRSSRRSAPGRIV